MTHPSEPGAPERDPPARRDTPVDCAADGEDARETSGSIRTGPFVVEWHVSRAADATLVTVHVTNTLSVPRAVRLRNRLDGPVLPPRRRGTAEVGWDDDGLTRRVPGEGRVSVGYACRAPPETPPVDACDDPADGTADDAPLDKALRSLGDHAPPRSVVSSDPSGGTRDAAASGDPAPSPDAVSESRDASRATDDENDPGPDVPGDEEFASGGDDDTGPLSDAPGSSPEAVPETVAAWFRAVEARLVTADRLAGDVEDATPVVASLGGRTGVAVLAETLDADATALAHVATRAEELADRVDAADVPDLEDAP